jgi:hypothetical protein
MHAVAAVDEVSGVRQIGGHVLQATSRLLFFQLVPTDRPDEVDVTSATRAPVKYVAISAAAGRTERPGPV